MKQWIFEHIIEPLFRLEIAMQEREAIERVLLRYAKCEPPQRNWGEEAHRKAMDEVFGKGYMDSCQPKPDLNVNLAPVQETERFDY